MKKHILAVILLLSFSLTACTEPVPKTDLGQVDIIEFSLDILSESFEEENILISPLSIVSALGMLGNGAGGNTLSQMEEVVGTDIQSLNDYLRAYTLYLPKDDKYKVNLANSIWFKDKEGLTIKEEFLQINKDYYDANVYKAPFDEKTKDDINNWVKDKTDGMIDTLLEQAPDKDVVMYLINALSFDAEWEDIYEDSRIYEGEFTRESGEVQIVEFMSSSETAYLENEKSTGFIKPYKDNKYAFVGLLPKEGIQMGDFIESLSSEDFKSLIENKEDQEVYVEMPKFSVEYDILLNETLESLNMIDAFDAKQADFTNLGQSTAGNIFVSRVIHKTKIDVDEKGTKAGAVTAVEMKEEMAMEEPMEVILNRPFVYMIIDSEQNLPLFIGSLMDVN